MAAALGLLLGGAASGRAQDILLPRTLALAFGVNSTPTPPPTPTPTPTPPPTPDPAAPRAYDYPENQPLVNITLPAKWSATYERGTGKLLCSSADAQTGYSAVLGRGGDFADAAQARAYLEEQVRNTVAAAKLTAIKISPVNSGPLKSGLDCQVQAAEGKIGATPTSFVFMCVGPVGGKYFLFVVRGRTDKLNAKGYDVMGAVADTIKAL